MPSVTRRLENLLSVLKRDRSEPIMSSSQENSEHMSDLYYFRQPSEQHPKHVRRRQSF
jgi:hypothetical protein